MPPEDRVSRWSIRAVEVATTPGDRPAERVLALGSNEP